MVAAFKNWIDDKNKRSLIYQLVTLIIVVYLGMFFFSNTVHNLQKQKIASGWDFLTQEAGFPIGEGVVEYSPADSYRHALWVGFLNTIKVALIGNVLAVILGTLIGVARLSKNWLVSRLSLCYIESLRNVPLLLQLFFWYTVITDILPIVRKALKPFPGVFLSNRGFVFPIPKSDPVFETMGWAFLVGFLLIFLVLHFGKKYQDKTGRSLPVVRISLGLLVGLPFLIWLIGGSPTALDIPKQGRFNFSGGYTLSPEIMALLLGLVLYTGAFIAEVVRAGILSVKKGQTEAAMSLGLKPHQVLRLVTFPQALRVIVPPLTSQILNLTKNSSLAVAIGYPDFVSVNNTTLNQTGQAVECIFLIIVLYLSTSLITSVFMNWYNKNIALVER
jgi:general L-amino acid transport system permease protein